MRDVKIRRSGHSAHPVHLVAATLLRVSAEGLATVLVLVVHSRTGQAATAGYLQAAVMLPYVLAGPVIGDVLDRARRPRAVVLRLAVLYAGTTAVLLAVAGRVPLPLALLVAVVVGCTEPVVVAMTALLPRLVPADRLTRAYGLEAATYNVAAIAGPGLAAVLTAGPGADVAAMCIVGSAVLGTLGLLGWRVRGSDVAEPAGRLRAGVLTGGLRVLFANRVLRSLTVATTLAFTGMGGIAVIAVLLAGRLGESAGAGGRLLAVFAAGALFGSLAAARWLPARRVEWVLPIGLVAVGGSLLLGGVVPDMAWATCWFLLAGFWDGPVFAATMLLRQREAPADRLGQVNSTAGSLKIGGAALGAALAALLAEPVGAVALLMGVGGLHIVGAVAGAVLLLARRSRH